LVLVGRASGAGVAIHTCFPTLISLYITHLHPNVRSISNPLGAKSIEGAAMTASSTPDRAAINRENSLKSTGPITDAGKKVSSLNALRHGLTGQTLPWQTM
jgi:hypothetical protein